MKSFRYTAVDTKGKPHRGTRDAQSPEQLRLELRAQGLLPTAVRSAGLVPARLRRAKPSSRLSAAEVAVFTRQMATLLSSKVQVEAALAAVASQSTPRLSSMCGAVRAQVLDGGSLSAALARQTGQFDRFYLTSVQAAEQAGRLGAVLDHLAEHVETTQRHRQTVVLALIYPAILIVVSIAVVLALLIFVLPDIVRVFAARGAELPTLTRVMITFSDLLSRYGIFLVLALVVLAAGTAAWLRKPAQRQAWHRVLWRLGLARQIVLVQFTGTLSTLMQSGVTLTDALVAATATVGNLEARRHLSAAGQDVREGMSLSRALAARPGFPPMMITMIASGEASGSLPAMLARFWADQSQSLQARVKALVALVEPLVLLGMGGVVMLLVLAILLPIVNLNGLVG